MLTYDTVLGTGTRSSIVLTKKTCKVVSTQQTPQVSNLFELQVSSIEVLNYTQTKLYLI